MLCAPSLESNAFRSSPVPSDSLLCIVQLTARARFRWSGLGFALASWCGRWSSCSYHDICLLNPEHRCISISSDRRRRYSPPPPSQSPTKQPLLEPHYFQPRPCAFRSSTHLLPFSPRHQPTLPPLVLRLLRLLVKRGVEPDRSGKPVLVPREVVVDRVRPRARRLRPVHALPQRLLDGDAAGRVVAYRGPACCPQQ
jgi:hypothetical protein